MEGFEKIFDDLPIMELPIMNPLGSSVALSRDTADLRTRLEKSLRTSSSFEELEQLCTCCEQFVDKMQNEDAEAFKSKWIQSSSFGKGKPFEANVHEELAMIQMCRAICTLRMAKIMTPSDLTKAVQCCRQAAGIFDLIRSVLLGHVEQTRVPDLDATVIHAVERICLATGQQLSILGGLELKQNMPFRLRAKLHRGCEGLYKAAYDALRTSQIICIPPSSKTLLGFCDTFSRLHSAEVSLNVAHCEYASAKYGDACSRMAKTAKLYSARTAVSGVGIPAFSDPLRSRAIVERQQFIAKLLSTWNEENAKVYFEKTPQESDLRVFDESLVIVNAIPACGLEWITPASADSVVPPSRPAGLDNKARVLLLHGVSVWHHQAQDKVSAEEFSADICSDRPRFCGGKIRRIGCVSPRRRARYSE